MMDFNHSTQKSEKPTDKILALIDAAILAENEKQSRRDYLGASMLGGACERAVQYEYAGAPKDEGKGFNAKTLRIFSVGHLFEPLAYQWLRDAGFVISTHRKDGKQHGFELCDGKIAGHCDGVLTDGPAVMRYPALLELKTMNEKSWNDCVKNGVRKSKPVYAAQISLYQAYLKLAENPCLFLAINKNTSEIYLELVKFDPELAQKTSDRGVKIIEATEAGELLPRGFSQQENLACKWCAFAKRCWK